MKKVLLLSFLLAAGYFGFAQSLMITNVNLIDVENGDLLKDRNILVQDGKVTGVSHKKLPKILTEQSIDGRGKYLMPGMMDGHIHFFQTGGLYTRPDALDLRSKQPYNDERKLALDLTTDHFNRYLRMGVTTVVDVGGPFTNFLIRDSLAVVHVAPNVLVTGPLFSTYQPANLGTIDPPIILTDTKEKVDSLFAKMLPMKPDFIKVWYIVKPGQTAESTYPIIEYISKKTHEVGLKLAIHSTQLRTAKLAVKAGTDMLVHSIDDEIIPTDFIKELKEKNIGYIPTLMVHNGYISTFTLTGSNHPLDIKWANPAAYGSLKDLEAMSKEEVPQKLQKIWAKKEKYLKNYSKGDSIMLLNLDLLNKNGIQIATGTDAGNIGTMHASSYYQELAWMKEGGMSPADILKASTIQVARTFGVENTLGTIEIGKIADMLLLDENPLEDINNLNSLTHVIKNGEVLMVDTLIKETPEMLVQRQLNAYNARNVDEFMATYSDSIELYTFPNTLISKGQSGMKERYTKMFASTPNLHCEIKERIVLGNKIIDQEYVRFNDNYVNAVAVYEVENGKIVKVTFIK